MRKTIKRAPKQNVTMLRLAEKMLRIAEEMFEDAGGLDTFVRDVVADGLARIVYCAYDTRACGLGNLNTEEFHVYVAANTHEWFKSHGFVDWYCSGAATLFQTTHLPVREFKIVRKKAS